MPVNPLHEGDAADEVIEDLTNEKDIKAEITYPGLYRMRFLKESVMQDMLVQMDPARPLFKVIEAAKRYCEVNRIRFVFIEKAVTFVE